MQLLQANEIVDHSTLLISNHQNSAILKDIKTHIRSNHIKPYFHDFKFCLNLVLLSSSSDVSSLEFSSKSLEDVSWKK